MGADQLTWRLSVVSMREMRVSCMGFGHESFE